MKMHIYHCALAVFKDVAPRSKKARPEDLEYWPSQAGQCDVSFSPLLNDLIKDGKTKKLVKLFEHIDLMDTTNSPIHLRRDWIAEQLGIDMVEVNSLMAKLYNMRLLHSLTLEHDFRKWLQHSKTKGCLVVMVGIEHPDYSKPAIEDLASEVIKEAYIDLLHSDKKGHEINASEIRVARVFVVPNAHLSPDLGLDHARNIQILQGIVRNLLALGFDSMLNSYGYPKDIQLMIVGHSQEYVLRCI